MQRLQVYYGDCLKLMEEMVLRGDKYDCVFADPPDNIDLNYRGKRDKQDNGFYIQWFHACLTRMCQLAPVVWVSFNSRWLLQFAKTFDVCAFEYEMDFKPCVQTFTFGQHSHSDFGNNHRPLWRLSKRGALFYPDAIRVPSWRQENGDKRADDRGRVPGDVFDFTRVTGNSKQRREWHPTQLNEGLVERCLRFSCPEPMKPFGSEYKIHATVLDPFAGTGTTLRVCERIGLSCTTIDHYIGYVRKIAEENNLSKLKGKPVWERTI